MSRPTYETEGDWANQSGSIVALAAAFKCQIVTLKKFYCVDLAAIRNGKLAALIEYKRRKNHSTKYPDLILSLHKVVSLGQFSFESGVPALVVIEWDDGMFYHKLKPASEYLITIGGRTDRDDPADTEPVCHLLSREFTKVQ